MTIKDLTQDALFNQTKYQIEPITEDELIKFLESGFVNIDEMIIGAGLTTKETTYLKTKFSKHEPETKKIYLSHKRSLASLNVECTSGSIFLKTDSSRPRWVISWSWD